MVELKTSVLTKASQTVYSVKLLAGHDCKKFAFFFLDIAGAPSRVSLRRTTINFEGTLTKEHPNTLNSICFLLLGYHGCKVNKTKEKTSIKFYLHTVNVGNTFIEEL